MRLALSVGRLDFWNIPTGKTHDALTPYEEAVWRAYEIVEPFGERRADLRMAVNTISLLQAQSTRQFNDMQVRNMLDSLVNYLKRDEDVLSPDQAASMVRRT